MSQSTHIHTHAQSVCAQTVKRFFTDSNGQQKVKEREAEEAERNNKRNNK